MTFVFSGFSFIIHLADHLASFSRSFCSYYTAKFLYFTHGPLPGISANCDLLVW